MTCGPGDTIDFARRNVDTIASRFIVDSHILTLGWEHIMSTKCKVNCQMLLLDGNMGRHGFSPQMGAMVYEVQE